MEKVTEIKNSDNHKKKHPYPIWLEGYLWKKGKSANPKGRPKGKTLKERVREMIENMDEEQKKSFLSSIHPADIWRMAEGNPHQTKDITSGGKPIGTILDDLDEDDK